MLGAYWGARKESADRCAERLRAFFADLAVCDPALATWYERGSSRKQASEKRAKVGDLGYLMRLLDRGRSRRDVGGTLIEELGFGIGLWNGGEEGKVAGLSINCGLYWKSANPNVYLGNCVTLDFPEELGELVRTEHMARVLAVVARAWEPDWAGVMSKDAMRVRTFNPKIPFVDWMVFVPRWIESITPPSSIVRLQGLGSVLVAQTMPPSGNDPEELRRIRGIEKVLLI
jgi:hypothetical protein